MRLISGFLIPMDRDPRLFLQDIENIYVTDEFVPTTTNEPTNERNERIAKKDEPKFRLRKENCSFLLKPT